MNKSKAFKDINKQSFYMFFKNDYFKSNIQKIQLFLFKIFFFPTNLSIIYKNGKKSQPDPCVLVRNATGYKYTLVRYNPPRKR